MSTFDDFAVEQLAARDKLIASLRAELQLERAALAVFMQPQIRAPRDEIASLRAEVARLEKDAMRYRWIREQGCWETEAFLMNLTPEEFDNAVDDRYAPPLPEPQS